MAKSARGAGVNSTLDQMPPWKRHNLRLAAAGKIAIEDTDLYLPTLICATDHDRDVMAYRARLSRRESLIAYLEVDGFRDNISFADDTTKQLYKDLVAHLRGR